MNLNDLTELTNIIDTFIAPDVQIKYFTIDNDHL